LLDNGLGRYEHALTAAQEAGSDPLDLYPASELVEAAARRGEVGIAQNALERLAATSQPSGTRVRPRDRGTLAGASERRLRRRVLVPTSDRSFE
jgi:hypothetical protein